MDIRVEFGKRVKELRARSGMSQETLAFRAGLDRTYLSGVERGERNISIVNIEKIAAALQVSVAYMFSEERFSTNNAYQPQELSVPIHKRFQYALDTEKRVLAFALSGLPTAEDVGFIDKTLMGVCSAFGKDELTLLVDHRDMKTSDGEPVVYSPEVAERAVEFQQRLLKYNKTAVVLCNSEFQVQQLNHVTALSGIHSIHLYGEDKEMVGKAFHILGIHGNELIRAKA